MFLRKVAKRTAFMGWFITAFAITNIPGAQAAPIVYFNNAIGNVCDTEYSSNAMHGNRFIARSAITITNIDIYIGGGSQTGFSSARYFLMSDSATTNLPTTILETFTPSSITGTGSGTLARFIGSYTVASGTKFWIVNGQYASAFPICYTNTNSALSFTMNGMTVDTSTSNSNSSFRRAYAVSTGNIYTTSWASVTTDAYAWQILVSGTGAPTVVAAIGTQSGSLSAVYRTVTPLTATVNTQSAVTFYANGKYIAGCRNILSSGGTATCNWRPSVHGPFKIYAAANPVSSSYVASNTSTISVGVVARTNKR